MSNNEAADWEEMLPLQMKTHLKAPLPAFKLDLRNILELRFKEKSAIVVEGARFQIERRGPVVEFLLQ